MLSRAIFEGAVQNPDERGLMPLAEARAHLAAVDTFERGEGREVPGHGYILDSDVLWAALLSLENAAEFCAVATRLEWRFPPRGMENVDLYERYGEGILPFLASRVRGDRIENVPWCVVPCLLACDSDDAFELVWRAPLELSGFRLDTAWLARHPERGARALAQRAQHGDRRALALLFALWAGPQGASLSSWVPEAPELAWLRGGAWNAAAVLALLDAFATRQAPTDLLIWPQPSRSGAGRVHGARVVLFREGADWGLAIERIEGDRVGGIYPLQISVYAYGSRIRGAVRGGSMGRRPIALTNLPRAKEELAPALAVHLKEDPALIFGPEDASRAAVALGDDAKVVFSEVVDPAEVHAAQPSQSLFFQRLADLAAAPPA